jgi:hypothetical protein
MSDYRQMQELEQRRRRAETVLDEALLAHEHGYFTNEDIEDIRHALGLAPTRNPYSTRNQENEDR